VAGEDRRVGGRPPHPGQAHLVADDAVHQRRLARPGRTHQRHEERRRGLTNPGQQVVVDLAEQFGALSRDLFRTGDVEHQRDGGDPLVQVQQGRLKEPGVHPDPGMLPFV
jgi:hypothetical protein